jgi:hypothetical protein
MILGDILGDMVGLRFWPFKDRNPPSAQTHSLVVVIAATGTS